MAQIDQVILTIDEVDVEVIVIAPAYWPRFSITKPIAAVVEAILAAYHLRMTNVEMVLAAKVRMEIGIGDPTVLDAAAVVFDSVCVRVSVCD